MLELSAGLESLIIARKNPSVESIMIMLEDGEKPAGTTGHIPQFTLHDRPPSRSYSSFMLCGVFSVLQSAPWRIAVKSGERMKGISLCGNNMKPFPGLRTPGVLRPRPTKSMEWNKDGPSHRRPCWVCLCVRCSVTIGEHGLVGLSARVCFRWSDPHSKHKHSERLFFLSYPPHCLSPAVPPHLCRLTLFIDFPVFVLFLLVINSRAMCANSLIDPRTALSANIWKVWDRMFCAGRMPVSSVPLAGRCRSFGGSRLGLLCRLHMLALRFLSAGVMSGQHFEQSSWGCTVMVYIISRINLLDVGILVIWVGALFLF